MSNQNFYLNVTVQRLLLFTNIICWDCLCILVAALATVDL